MNIDFHYGVVYAMARLGGLAASDALTVAHACQYVDDSTTPGLLDFSGGETFERFPTAHSLFDYHNRIQRRQPPYLGTISFFAGGRRPVVRRARDLPTEQRGCQDPGATSN